MTFPPLSPLLIRAWQMGPGPRRPLIGRDPWGPRRAERAFGKTALLSSSKAAIATPQSLEGSGGSLRLAER